jgi:RNA polymerase sigma-70 factor (ECF subfamily)
MTDAGTTVRVQRCLDRLNAGDASARAELLSAACDRLRALTHRMLRDYRAVRRWEDTDDVLQNALLRLCRALEQLSLPTPRDFFRLAAAQVRRELIDLARHYYGPAGAGANLASAGPAEGGADRPDPLEAPDRTHDPGRVALWTEFHRLAEALPEPEWEVFDLLFYQDLSQAEAAELLGTSERSVRRWWQSARLRLHEALGGQWPDA